MLKNKFEFIALIASLMAMVALTIDAVLPALGLIASDLLIKEANNRQLIITIIFTGLSIGNYIYGPISDSLGRRPVILFGLSLFLLGTGICYFATDFNILILGRLVQGLGVAGSNNVAIAIVRDGFKGNEMAKVMSIVMATFMIVPILAPSLGQLVLFVADWRQIFLMLLIFAIVLMLWFGIRQPETLSKENRRAFSLRDIFIAFKEVVQNKVAIACTIISGLAFGAFISFLSSSQQIIQEDYETGPRFALYFAILVFAFAAASICNSRLVVKIGAKRCIRYALIGMVCVTLVFAAPFLLADERPSLWIFIAFIFMESFCLGFLMGNLNAVALEPLGHLAGTAAAVVAGTSTLIASTIGASVGSHYAGDVSIYLFAYFAAGSLALLLSVTMVKIKPSP